MRWFFTICLLVTGLLCSPGARTDDIVELRARADQGHASARFNLGLLYNNGRGVGAGDTHSEEECVQRGLRPSIEEGGAG